MTWEHRAACLDLDPELFFPDRSEDPHPVALRACARCPVRRDCYAAGVGDKWSIRAGLTAQQRGQAPTSTRRAA